MHWRCSTCRAKVQKKTTIIWFHYIRGSDEYSWEAPHEQSFSATDFLPEYSNEAKAMFRLVSGEMREEMEPISFTTLLICVWKYAVKKQKTRLDSKYYIIGHRNIYISTS